MPIRESVHEPVSILPRPRPQQLPIVGVEAVQFPIGPALSETKRVSEPPLDGSTANAIPRSLVKLACPPMNVVGVHVGGDVVVTLKMVPSGCMLRYALPCRSM